MEVCEIDSKGIINRVLLTYALINKTILENFLWKNDYFLDNFFNFL